MQVQKVDKFIRFAEVLPNNANSAKIIKEREEIAQAKADRDKAVSSIKYDSCIMTNDFVFIQAKQA